MFYQWIVEFVKLVLNLIGELIINVGVLMEVSKVYFQVYNIFIDIDGVLFVSGWGYFFMKGDELGWKFDVVVFGVGYGGVGGSSMS